jgi:hypothetical protein
MQLCALVLVSIAVFLGCGGGSTPVSASPPPLSPTIIIKIKWTGTGNPKYRACGTPPCLVNYTLRDETTHTAIATIKIGIFQYTFTGPRANSTHKYSLTVNAKDAHGRAISSPKAITILRAQ